MDQQIISIVGDHPRESTLQIRGLRRSFFSLTPAPFRCAPSLHGNAIVFTESARWAPAVCLLHIVGLLCAVLLLLTGFGSVTSMPDLFGVLAISSVVFMSGFMLAMSCQFVIDPDAGQWRSRFVVAPLIRRSRTGPVSELHLVVLPVWACSYGKNTRSLDGFGVLFVSGKQALFAPAIVERMDFAKQYAEALANRCGGLPLLESETKISIHTFWRIFGIDSQHVLPDSLSRDDKFGQSPRG